MVAATKAILSPYDPLISPFEIRRTRFKNRMFMAPHGTGYAKGGGWGDQALAYYKARLDGGVALIVTEATQVVPVTGQGYAQLNGASDAFPAEVRKLTDICADYDARCIVQLYNEGRARAHSTDGSVEPALAPSVMRDERFHIVPVEMTTDQIEQFVGLFAAAAGRAVAGGADGVELLIGMGYLHGQFLSPRINVRTDAYGGSPENRHRFAIETLKAMREKMGDAPLLGFRVVPEDDDPDGMRMAETLAFCQAAAEQGLVDYISVTVGGTHTLAGTRKIVPPMYFDADDALAQASAVRKATNLPVMVAGRINQPVQALQAITSEAADMVGFVRALLTDPGFPNKVVEGDLDSIRACIGCNQACIGHRNKGHGVSCIQFPESGRELQYGSLGKAERAKHVVVVGGGPAGMKAAAVCAARGHKVQLFEKGRQLGGQALLAQALPGRAEFGGIVTNLKSELEQHGVSVTLNHEVTQAELAAFAPDEVILATGARPHMPVGEFEGAQVVQAWDVISGTAQVGGSVVVADWRCDWVGPGVAEMLAANGHKVVLCVNGEKAGELLQPYVRYALAGRMHEAGVSVVPYMRVFGADEDTAYFQHVVTGAPQMIEEMDTLVMAWGNDPVTDLVDSGLTCPVHRIGDCLSPRTAEEAVLEGLKVAAAL
ncbi:hypothetical protein AB838_08545 [Rhodobacteraceae bacterium (ex Bugula neritina AB1)]|nr:hypothetical protein AB838_08545 [Rhodobacteraceae bacterium (ex Bugula neritina AB1)]